MTEPITPEELARWEPGRYKKWQSVWHDDMVRLLAAVRAGEEMAPLVAKAEPILAHYFGCPEADKAFSMEVLQLVQDMREALATWRRCVKGSEEGG